jgi:hypothetical protein
MATVKKFSGNVSFQNRGSISSTITLDTETVIITGNLDIQGQTTVIESNNLTITDRVIVLNKGEPGAGITGGNAGIIIDRGTSPNVAIGYYESTNTWRITNDGTTYYNIATTTGGSAISAVVDDPKPVLGGNLNVTGKTIYSNVAVGSYVTLQGALELKTANVTPTASTGGTIFYAGTPGGGTAGVYVVNSSAANKELVTKTRAFGFSLIL